MISEAGPISHLNVKVGEGIAGNLHKMAPMLRDGLNRKSTRVRNRCIGCCKVGKIRIHGRAARRLSAGSMQAVHSGWLSILKFGHWQSQLD